MPCARPGGAAGETFHQTALPLDDATSQDPADPDSICPPYGTGAGVHADVAGQQAIADSIPLDLLVGAAPAC